MLAPNKHRILVELIEDPKSETGLIIPKGAQTIGENLMVGKIVHSGDTEFAKDQLVYFSDYSMSSIVDVRPFLDGGKALSEMQDEKQMFIVAADDVMAYEVEKMEVNDPSKV